METSKKTKGLYKFGSVSDQAFDMAKTMNNASRVANLYGKLFAIKDMQIHLLEQEKKIKEELDKG
jgi:hypothetical protein|tara:strand:+ start:625 stop:819 length:195 start_codon:yes stop_codon:yes gene_type:complete